MKTEKYYLILVAVIGILCVPVLGEVKLPLQKGKPFLAGRAAPALAGIEKLYVIIEPSDAKPGKDGLVWKELQEKVEHKLKKTGIEIAPGVYLGRGVRAHDIPELRVYMEMLKFTDSQLYVFRIQTSLATEAYLKERKLFFKADVWKAEPIMQAASIKDMPVTVTNVVLDQVGAFIESWLAVNPKDRPPAEANEISTVPRKQLRPVAKPAVAKYKYVASKNRKVFHKADCSFAKRILPKNLIGYNNKAEATNAGKRPCRICKP